MYFLAFIILAFVITLFFAILVFKRPIKTITVVKEVPVLSAEDVSKESKSRKEQDLEQKSIEQQNQKKSQIVSEISRNLHSGMNLEDYSNQALINISKHYDIFQAIFFVIDKNDNIFKKSGAYAYYTEDDLPEFTEGVGLTGQVAANKKLLNISNLPDRYITVLSGLGKSAPSNLLIVPVVFSDKTIAIIELASFKKFDSLAEQVIWESAMNIAQHLSEILNKN